MNADFSTNDPVYPVRVSVKSRYIHKEGDTSAAYLTTTEAEALIRDLQEALIRAESDRLLRLSVSLQEAQS